MKRFLLSLRSVNKIALFLFLILIAIGSYARATNLFNLGFAFDTVQTQYTWAEAALKLGYGAFWRDYLDHFDYLPASLIYIMFEGLIAKVIDPIIPGGSAQAFVTTTKLLNWLVEVALAFVIARLSIKYGKLSRSRALVLAGLVYFAPSIWFVSAVWGQIDSIVLLMALLSIWMMFKGKEFGEVKWYRNYFFWSGVLFAFTFWFKPQIILTIPAVLLFYFAGKNGEYVVGILKQMIIWLVAFALCVLLGVYLYFNTTNSTFFINFLIIAFLSVLTLYTLWKFIKSKGTVWYQIASQGFGVWISSFLILILPLAYFAPKVIFVLALPYLKADDTSSGAANFWPLIGMYGKGRDKIFEINNIGISVSLFANLAFLFFMLYFYWKYYGINLAQLKQMIRTKLPLHNIIEHLIPQKFNFTQFVFLTTIVSSIFFLFMTKMHSRYLIWGIIFSLLGFGLIQYHKNWKYWLLAIIVMNIGFFFNQLGVYAAWNSEPGWVSWLLQRLHAHEGQFSSTLNFIGIMGLYLWTWLNWNDLDSSPDKFAKPKRK